MSRTEKGALASAEIARQSVELAAQNRRLEVQSQEVLRANRMKSEFLANMSHELRTPLNAIIGFAELMHDEKVGPVSPQHKEFLGDILTSARHLLQLINDVLDLSKVEAGKLAFSPEPLDVPKVIDQTLGMLSTIAASKTIRVESEVDPGLGEVVLDSARLKQVLYNFVSNALKFTPPGGSVVVRAQRGEPPSAFRLEVQDTGIGIAPDDMGRLFKAFEQLDEGSARRHAGTGLGLVLTRRLVEAQGGTVGVRSVAGQGSTFHAGFPSAPRPPRLAR